MCSRSPLVDSGWAGISLLIRAAQIKAMKIQKVGNMVAVFLKAMFCVPWLQRFKDLVPEITYHEIYVEGSNLRLVSMTPHRLDILFVACK